MCGGGVRRFFFWGGGRGWGSHDLQAINHNRSPSFFHVDLLISLPLEAVQRSRQELRFTCCPPGSLLLLFSLPRHLCLVLPSQPFFFFLPSKPFLLFLSPSEFFLFSSPPFLFLPPPARCIFLSSSKDFFVGRRLLPDL